MKLQLLNKSNSTPDSVSLYFKRTGILDYYKAGQHALLSLEVNGVVVKRAYSFHTSPTEDECVGITVRAIDGGVASNFLQLATADTPIWLDGISGDFFLEPHEKQQRHFIMLAAGSGITPMLSMIKTVLHREPLSSVSLIYVNRNYSRIIFRAELATLSEQFSSRLQVYYILSDDECVPPEFPVFYKGRLSKLVAKKILKNLTTESRLEQEYFICGPHSFMQLCEDVIQIVDGGKSVVNKEHFFIPTREAEFNFNELQTKDVILQTRNEEYLVRVEGGKPVLESALMHRVNISYSCTEGQCGVCRAHLIRGQVKLRRNFILTPQELERDEILLCQAFPLTDNVVIKIEN